MNVAPPSPAADYGSPTLAALRVAGFLSLLVAMIPVQLVYNLLRPGDAYRLPLLFHKLLLKLIGFEVRVHGGMAANGPVFFVANHASYLDIPVLGSLIPASFVAKAEVASWPLFGTMARLQNTIFIERRQVRTLQQRDRLTQHLADGRSLILFPEGTSSDGQRVLPFKSSLFSAIESTAAAIDVAVQPVSVSCTGLDGLPLTWSLRPFYAWYGDMTLLPHLWQAFKCSRFTVDVVFHPPVQAREAGGRKQLALLCEQAVAAGVSQCVTGRWLETSATSPMITAPV